MLALFRPLASAMAPLARLLAPLALPLEPLRPIVAPATRVLDALVDLSQPRETWVIEPRPTRTPAPTPAASPEHVCSFCSSLVFTLRSAPVTPELPWTIFTGRICEECWEKEGKPYEAAYRQALVSADDVETWSINYKGIVPVDARGQLLTSDWSRNKTANVRQLKVAAAFLGFDTLIEVDGEKHREGCDGNHRYRLWQATARTGKYIGKRPRRRRP